MPCRLSRDSGHSFASNSPFRRVNFKHSDKLDDRNSRFAASVRQARASKFDALVGSLRSIFFDHVWKLRLDTPG
jgi:hypothetical protein